ncbi:hypothetical protein RQP54_18225 [Curvibacter sp. APW13]|uniref:hypothetical protein n=1 Tax=Curvibacter sp. APW13 TaxID=3077236 RepID=UPI0028DF38B4|nr:hypothetical protein [Curvibacter sp. APW13]MDT8992816.1 hypothetical protein [Curvibacter sp. APW13]
MIFPNPNNKGVGKLTIAERSNLGSTLEELGLDPKQNLAADDVMQAMLLNAAKAHDQKHPGSNQVQAARNFRNNRK